jgi:GntR family transcriptional regulator / MocR family aminotransferase
MRMKHHKCSVSVPEAMRPAFSIQLDRKADTSLVEQIRHGISAAIDGGVLAPGARLPSWQVLAAQLGVARGTVREAYDRLVDAQMIVSSGSAGTHVAARPTRRRTDEAVIDDPADQLMMRRDPDGRAAMFQVGVPAQDAFPVDVFARLRARTAREEVLAGPVYADSRGDLDLRREIAAHLALSRGIECSVAQIFITSGFAGAMAVVMHVLRACGQTAWLEDPGFPYARQAMQLAGVTTVPVPVDAEGIDVDAGLRRAPTATLAMVTPGQQAPLGYTLSLERRLQLIDWATRRGAWIIEDDYLGELQLSGRAAPALASLDTDGRVIHIGSFSKTISPALRLGFIVAPPSLVPVFTSAASSLLPAPGTAVQRATAAFMGEGHYLRHLRRMKRLYASRRDQLLAALARRGLSGHPAGLAVLVDLPEHADDAAIVRAAIAGGIAPNPLSIWFHSPDHARRGLLLGVATVRCERLDEACDRLRRAIDSASDLVPDGTART